MRHFFRVGGAANTIAETMSAYDMTFSDEIYGKATRYVSRDRLNAMLSHEYKLLLERLSAKRGTTTKFFAFANTVATKGYKGNKESHGWLGIRFQSDPLEGPSDIILHVRMIDSDNLLQQEALGIVGVNLIYAAFYLSDDIDQMVTSFLDALSTARIEIDMLEVSGPKFSAVDNRLVSLKLLKLGLTAAVLLPPDGKVQQPSEVLYQRQLIVERGKFQPVTYLHVDMLDQARSYVKSLELSGSEPLLLCEITLNNLGSKEQLKEEELLAHADELGALGYTVLVSEYPEFHRLSFHTLGGIPAGKYS